MTDSLRLATWNVHCGVFDGTSSARRPDLTSMADCLRAVSADVVCMQEFPILEGGVSAIAERLTRELDYAHVQIMRLSRSHLLAGDMGLVVMSRFPVSTTTTEMLPNPGLQITKQGQHVNSHDKGVLSVTVTCGTAQLRVLCVQLFPFHSFDVNSLDDMLEPARLSLKRLLTLSVRGPVLLCGDLNVADLNLFLPDARADFGLTDLIHRPTRRNGRIDDHILHSAHFDASAIRVIPSPSDHHLCVADLVLRPIAAIDPTATAATHRYHVSGGDQSVSILHLSDLHFGPGESEPADWKTSIQFAERHTMRDIMVNVIRDRGLPRCPDFVVVSGDVTVTGGPQGWKQYRDTIDPLINDNLLPPANRFVLVPGNHDVIRSDPDTATEEASRWRPFIEALGRRHVRPWIPAVDGAMEPLLLRARARMTAQKTCWGGIEHEVDEGTQEQRTVVFPYLYDRERAVLLYAFNSSSVSGTTTPLSPDVIDDIKFLQQLEGPYHTKLRNVLAALNELRRIDPARIDPREATLFHAILGAIAEREGSRFGDVLKVAVLHHHVTSIFPEEVKSFETLLNAGLFKRQLQAEGFHLILHGHKHWAEAFIDTATSGGGRHVVVSGGTVAGTAPAGMAQGFHWIDWHRRTGRLRTRFVRLPPARQPSGAFTDSAESVFWLRRGADNSRLQVLVDEPSDAVDVGLFFRQAEQRLLAMVRSSTAADGMTTTGWSHRLRGGTFSTIATAYGLKIMALVGTEQPRFQELRPLVIQTLLALRLPGGGWTATSQGTQWRPEATCWVLDALFAWNPDLEAVGEGALALERLLERGSDGAIRRRTLSTSMILRTLCRIRPRSPWISQLASELLASAAFDSTGMALFWGEELNEFENRDHRTLSKPSPVHTAHAVLALLAASAASEKACGLGEESLDAVRAWLLRQNWDDSEEQIRRDSARGHYEQLIVNHFTAPWIITTLLRAGHPVQEPRLRSALGQLIAARSSGLWNWGMIDLPIWATHDALLALKEAAMAGCVPCAGRMS